MIDYFINITITTSITACIILIVKKLLKSKISPNWQFIIWIVLFMRLVIPVLPKSNMSIFNTVPQVKDIEVSQKFIKSIPSGTKDFATENITLGEKNKEFVLSEVLVDNIFFIWAVGAVIMLLFMSITYYSFHKKTRKLKILSDSDIMSILDKCRKAVEINKDVIVRLGGETPMLKGIIKPEILLPEGYTKEELISVFTHELIHYKHKDVLWNIISTILLCVYWYNPIMWYCSFVFRRDMEILCDYRVLEINKNKKEYSNVLLKTALRKNKFILGTTSLQNGEKDVTKRIKYIAYFKEPKVIWSIAIVVIVTFIAVTCLTNPVIKSHGKFNKSKSEKLYEYKTQYVGTAYKVGNLTDYLNYSEYKNQFSLQTKSEPYGITINYKIKPEVFSEISYNKVLENAAVIFCLVDNVDTVTFEFCDGEKSDNFSFNRGLFNSAFGKNIREYSSSLKIFKDEFIPMIKKQDWSEIKEKASNSSTFIRDEVEKNLEIIISSPKTSSNPSDYIKIHRKEYENILKMGDEALEYMLSLFKDKKTKGLKSHIMMSLCIDLLGDRNNVKEGSYASPEQWYEKFSQVLQ
ncbi:M56 family metallopeptidase [Clostridium lundense]|uniref:M56 family metallopeptidase n=1 Tax=Clostridium lundense TaxID=319475 RepID=UPI0004810282|nr:M56 family metallopeptidase [Clostridium lundense]